MHHLAYIYAVVYLAGTALAVLAQETIPPTPVWVLLLIPVIPVVVGYLLTKGKLKKQDAKVQEIHVLVNSRLSKTLDALSEALIENIVLKGRLGIPVSAQERQDATNIAKEKSDLP